MATETKSFRRFKKEFEPMADAYRVFYDLVCDMPTKTLKRFLRQGENLSDTNCGWTTYEAFRNVFEKIAEEEIKRREYRAKKAKRRKVYIPAIAA